MSGGGLTLNLWRKFNISKTPWSCNFDAIHDKWKTSSQITEILPRYKWHCTGVVSSTNEDLVTLSLPSRSGCHDEGKYFYKIDLDYLVYGTTVHLYEIIVLFFWWPHRINFEISESRIKFVKWIILIVGKDFWSLVYCIPFTVFQRI